MYMQDCPQSSLTCIPTLVPTNMSHPTFPQQGARIHIMSTEGRVMPQPSLNPVPEEHSSSLKGEQLTSYSLQKVQQGMAKDAHKWEPETRAQTGQGWTAKRALYWDCNCYGRNPNFRPPPLSTLSEDDEKKHTQSTDVASHSPGMYRHLVRSKVCRIHPLVDGLRTVIDLQ
jgi:hypothetical protein